MRTPEIGSHENKKKQVLINSTTTEFTFSTTATSKNITLSRNVINLIVPIEILNANEFYTCKIRMKNSQLDLIVYNFQLLLDNYAPSIPAIKQASIVFDELTYTLLIQNTVCHTLLIYRRHFLTSKNAFDSALQTSLKDRRGIESSVASHHSARRRPYHQQPI